MLQEWKKRGYLASLLPKLPHSRLIGSPCDGPGVGSVVAKPCAVKQMGGDGPAHDGQRLAHDLWVAGKRKA